MKIAYTTPHRRTSETASNTSASSRARGYSQPAPLQQKPSTCASDTFGMAGLQINTDAALPPLSRSQTLGAVPTPPSPNSWRKQAPASPSTPAVSRPRSNIYVQQTNHQRRASSNQWRFDQALYDSASTSTTSSPQSQTPLSTPASSPQTPSHASPRYYGGRPVDAQHNFNHSTYDDKSIYGVNAELRNWPQPHWDRAVLKSHYHKHQAEFDSLGLNRDKPYLATTVEAYDAIVKTFLASNVEDTAERFTRIGKDGSIVRYDRPTSLLGAIDPKTGRIRSFYRKGINDPSVARATPLRADPIAERNVCLGLSKTKHERRQSMQMKYFRTAA